jgi:hypothetical protein
MLEAPIKTFGLQASSASTIDSSEKLIVSVVLTFFPPNV